MHMLRKLTGTTTSSGAQRCTATSTVQLEVSSAESKEGSSDGASTDATMHVGVAGDELVVRKLSVGTAAHSRSASDATCARSFATAGLTPAPTQQGEVTCVYSVASHDSIKGDEDDDDDDDGSDDDDDGSGDSSNSSGGGGDGRDNSNSRNSRNNNNKGGSGTKTRRNNNNNSSTTADSHRRDDTANVTPLQLHPLPSPSNNVVPRETSPVTEAASSDAHTHGAAHHAGRVSVDNDEDEDDASMRTATPSRPSPPPRRSVVSTSSTATLSASRREGTESVARASACTAAPRTTSIATTTATMSTAANTAVATDAGAATESATRTSDNDTPTTVAPASFDDCEAPAVAARAHTHRSTTRPLRFKLIRELGAGASGTVYLAQLHSGTLVAVKALRRDRNDADRIDREVGVMSRLPPHPNCVRYYGSRHGKHHHYIVMESVSGGSIAATRRATGPFSECALRRYAREVLAGLVHLHTHGIVHRDIKGANVLLDDMGHAKIGDFGCCKDITQLNATWHASGTPRWMAPELCRGEAATLKSDVWSFGCLCLEMVNDTGVPWEAFAPHTPLERVVFEIGHATRPPPVPAHLSPAARDFIGACLQIDPAARASTIVLLDHVFFAMDTADAVADDDEDGVDDDDDEYNTTGTCALSMAMSTGRHYTHNVTATTATAKARRSGVSSGSSGASANSGSSGGSSAAAQAAAGAGHVVVGGGCGGGGGHGAAVALVLHSSTHSTMTTAATATATMMTTSTTTGGAAVAAAMAAAPAAADEAPTCSQASGSRWLTCAQAQLPPPPPCSLHCMGYMDASAVPAAASSSLSSPSLHNTAQSHMAAAAASSVMCAAPLYLGDSYAPHA